METNLACKFEEERREEIISGKTVKMLSPPLNHTRIAGNLYVLFRNYLDDGPFTPFSGNTRVILADDERYLPDVMVVCDPKKFAGNHIKGAPDLVVEVLSPGTARHDRGPKKDAYEKHGVREYWIVSPEERTVEQYVSENGRFVLRGVHTLYPQFMLDDMTDDERAAVPTEFTCALFDDLTVRLADVFKRVAP